MPLLETPWLEPFTDWIETVFAHQGVFIPILLLAIEESGVPLPIPGDVMIAYTGYNVAKGELSYAMALVALMLSVLIGSSILFWLSSKWGNSLIFKFGKFLHLHPERLINVEKKFGKYGPWVIIFGRHIPGFRIPITVFAGMSGIKYQTFILSTFISTIFWAIFYLDLGIRLGPRVRHFLRAQSSHWMVILGILLIALIAFVVYQRRKDK